MDKESISRQVAATMAKVFNVPPGTIGSSTSPDTLSSWDSVGHMNLIMALEEEFGVSFTDEQAIELRDFDLTVCVLMEALSAKG